jgi:hypothetical protein
VRQAGASRPPAAPAAGTSARDVLVVAGRSRIRRLGHPVPVVRQSPSGGTRAALLRRVRRAAARVRRERDQPGPAGAGRASERAV